MPIPTGFRKWRFHWFECPACRHRAWQTFANVSAARAPVRIVWRFWCERCGAFSTLQQPMLPTIAAAVMLLLVGPIAFVILSRALFAGVRFEWLVVLFGVIWVFQPLVLLAFTRFLYRYQSP